jgi:inhibitor of cysteine peptidase
MVVLAGGSNMFSRALRVVLFAAVVTACGGDGIISLSEADDGASIPLAMGDQLEVVLAGNPTTGYTWETEDLDPSVLRQVGDPSYVADTELVGSPGVFTFTFECVAASPTVLSLVYHRPWEDAPPLQTFTVTIQAG